MKNVYLTRISIVLLAMLCWSFTGVNSNESNKVLPSEEVMDFSSVDNSQSVAKSEGVVVPRMGQSYYGSIGYRGYSYPIQIFWDPAVESLNLAAFLGGSIEYPTSSVTRYVLQHISTQDSESTLSKFWIIIKCDYIIEHMFQEFEYTHVKFLVNFEPNNQFLSYQILEEGPGSWASIDRDNI